jgi:predicted amino acid racemase
MRSTLEEIYNSQFEIVKSEMTQSHEGAMIDLRETLDKNHKEELNRIEQEYSNKLEQLQLDYEAELKESRIGHAIGEFFEYLKNSEREKRCHLPFLMIIYEC